MATPTTTSLPSGRLHLSDQHHRQPGTAHTNIWYRTCLRVHHRKEKCQTVSGPVCPCQPVLFHQYNPITVSVSTGRYGHPNHHNRIPTTHLIRRRRAAHFPTR
ncbi:vegetative cell wall protein gp1-like [Iris pallida]|uniref:Vegetative cell wall protein gp1-like n=1 Tax=Iris pallida TaxID=29817 RepID=A0AAX6FQQ4_IRIPA|nr:vegetative cell wall protein gp1-like [Iris pallida]